MYFLSIWCLSTIGSSLIVGVEDLVFPGRQCGGGAGATVAGRVV